DHLALHAGVVGDETAGSDQRFPDDASTGRLVTGQLGGSFGNGVARPDEGNASAGDDAFFDRCTSCRHRVFDAVLLLLQLHLGGGADLAHPNASGQLGQTLLQLLAVPVAVGVLDLGLDLVDPTG